MALLMKVAGGGRKLLGIISGALLLSQAVLMHQTFAQQSGSPNTFEIIRPESIEPSVVGYPDQDYYDPWEPFNRRMFTFNDVVYRHALIPLSETYLKLPQPARTGVGNVFANLREPLHLINHGLQGKPTLSGRNFVRFITNTTVGILGIWDPANNWLGIAPGRTSLNETLQKMQVGAGPFLVMPLLGVTDLRGGSSRMVETFFNPIRYLVDSPESMLVIGFDNLQAIAPSASTYLVLRNESTDPYLYFRNQYLQGARRDVEFSLERD
jgi:phospholipid-binding lipoprotein MlaA